MRRKIAWTVLCILLLVGAMANLKEVISPEQKLTTYFRTHQYRFNNSDYNLYPDYETDVPATAVKILGINLALITACLVVAISGGLLRRKVHAA